MKFCPNCQKDISGNAKFCPECGSVLWEKVVPNFCARCGAKIDASMKCCPQCGTPIKVKLKNPATVQKPAAAMLSPQRQAVQRPIVPPNPVTPGPGRTAPAQPQRPVQAAPLSGTAGPAAATAADGSLILRSPAPLPKKTAFFNYIYIAACVVAVFMIMSSNMVLIGLFPITLTYLIHYYVTKIFNYRLRSIKFKFIPGVNVTVDDLYNRLQPSLFQRYGSQMEFDRDNEKLSVKYNGIIYDILMEGNGTFRLWWRKDVTGIVKELIFFTYAEFRLYNRARAGMGILAYEIQRDFGITK